MRLNRIMRRVCVCVCSRARVRTPARNCEFISSDKPVLVIVYYKTQLNAGHLELAII